MKCITCKVGNLQPGTTTVTLEDETTTVVFKNVPAEVCQACGEAYIDADITAQLLDDIDEAVRIGVQADIRQFVAAA